MILWLDAQLSPRLARWLNATFGVAASSVRDLDPTVLCLQKLVRSSIREA